MAQVRIVDDFVEEENPEYLGEKPSKHRRDQLNSTQGRIQGVASMA
jgi:hypothetical protein